MRQLAIQESYQLTPMTDTACYALASASAPLATQFSAAITTIKTTAQYQQLLQQYFIE